MVGGAMYAANASPTDIFYATSLAVQAGQVGMALSGFGAQKTVKPVWVPELVTDAFTPYRSGTTSLDFNISTSDWGKFTQVRINSDQFVLPNGEVTVPARKNPNGSYQMFEGAFVSSTGELNVGWLYTANRGMGIGTELMSRAIEAVGPANVKAISGELGADNLSIYQNNLRQGMTPLDAAKNTPAAAIRAKLGFGNISYDPITNKIRGSR